MTPFPATVDSRGLAPPFDAANCGTRRRSLRRRRLERSARPPRARRWGRASRIPRGPDETTRVRIPVPVPRYAECPWRVFHALSRSTGRSDPLRPSRVPGARWSRFVLVAVPSVACSCRLLRAFARRVVASVASSGPSVRCGARRGAGGRRSRRPGWGRRCLVLLTGLPTASVCRYARNPAAR